MAVEFLHELNVPFFKVGSGDTNNFPYLEKTAKKGKCGFFPLKPESKLCVSAPLVAAHCDSIHGDSSSFTFYFGGFFFF